MKFNKRKETKYFHVILRNTCKTYKQLFNEARRRGELDTGFHYVVDALGLVVSDRPEDAVAGWDLTDANCSIYVLVDAKKEMNDSQKLVVKKLYKKYSALTYKENGE